MVVQFIETGKFEPFEYELDLDDEMEDGDVTDEETIERETDEDDTEGEVSEDDEKDEQEDYNKRKTEL